MDKTIYAICMLTVEARWKMYAGLVQLSSGFLILKTFHNTKVKFKKFKSLTKLLKFNQDKAVNSGKNDHTSD